MKVRVLWVGKTREEWIRSGIAEYAGRIRHYASLEIAETREEKGAAAETMRERECLRLEQLLPKGARLILLDEHGTQLTSPGFATFLAKRRDTAVQELAFAIGGAYGFSQAFRARADAIISLSPMTFTHQMVRVVLLEQLYRAYTIINNEPYHH